MNHRQILPERLNETRVFFEETRVLFEDIREARVLLERINQTRAKLCEIRARRADLISRDVDARGKVEELDESIEGAKATIVELLAKASQHLTEANARCDAFAQRRLPE